MIGIPTSWESNIAVLTIAPIQIVDEVRNAEIRWPATQINARPRNGPKCTGLENVDVSCVFTPPISIWDYFGIKFKTKVLKFIPIIDSGFQIDGPNDKCDEEILKIFNTWDLPQLKPGGNRCQIKANYLQSRPPLQCGLILELDRNAARL